MKKLSYVDDDLPVIHINAKKHIHPDRVVIEIEFTGDITKRLYEASQAFLEEVALADGSPDDPPTIDHRRSRLTILGS